MRPDRDRDWSTRTPRGGSHVPRKPELQAIKRAALAAAQVTGDEHWDLLLSVVQERIEKLKGLKASAADSLESSDDFTTEGLINQKLAVRLYGKEIEALEWVINLPKSIMEQGDTAKELLGSVDETAH